MATNKEIIALLEKMANGDGIAGIKSEIESLNDKVQKIIDDLDEVKQHTFNNENSLRNRITTLERSVENIKQYELDRINDKLKVNQSNKNKIFIQSVVIVITLAVGYIASTLFGK